MDTIFAGDLSGSPATLKFCRYLNLEVPVVTPLSSLGHEREGRSEI